MKTLQIVSMVLLASAAQPAAGQDFFREFERMVEDLVPAQSAPPRVVRQAPTVAPVPQDRPEGLGDDGVEPAAGETAEVDAEPEVVEAPAEDAVETPAEATDEPEAVDAPAEDEVPLPEPRPEDEAADDEAPVEVSEPDAVEGEPEAAPEPVEARVYQSACPAVLMGLIKAEPLPPIDEGQCFEQSPLSVTGVMANGRMVPLSTPATLNCEMASTLPGWLASVDGYVRSREDSAIAEVQVSTSQFCRPRNNVEGADVSEHGFANALDVTGLALEDGRTVSVLDDWMPATSAEGRLLRYAHGAACSVFTTVLGPEANAQHEDHFHFDLGCHGQSCTAQICE